METLIFIAKSRAGGEIATVTMQQKVFTLPEIWRHRSRLYKTYVLAGHNVGSVLIKQFGSETETSRIYTILKGRTKLSKEELTKWLDEAETGWLKAMLQEQLGGTRKLKMFNSVVAEALDYKLDRKFDITPLHSKMYANFLTEGQFFVDLCEAHIKADDASILQLVATENGYCYYAGKIESTMLYNVIPEGQQAPRGGYKNKEAICEIKKVSVNPFKV